MSDGGLVAHGGPHVFVADLQQLALASDDAHHLRRALRLRSGDALTASDGLGSWRSCRFGSDDQMEPAGDIMYTTPPEPGLHVAFALVKGSRPELVVQKLTELGIDHIQPFVAERSVVRWDETKAAKNHERLLRVAREAAMQSRRAYLPTVSPLVDFSAFAGRNDVVRADMHGDPPDLSRSVVLVGPEGGWSPAERQAIAPTMGLGPHVLRAETAAIAVGAVLGAMRFGSIKGL